MKSKWLIIMMSLLMVFTLAACGEEGGNGGDDTPDGSPTISGMEDREVEVGAFVTDWLVGVSAENASGEDISDRIEIDTSEVDYYSEGSYTVTYSVTDSEGNEASETITVDVVGEMASDLPVIEGVDDVILPIGASDHDFLEGVSAEDAEDGDLTDLLEVDSSDVDFDEAGSYTVTYRVENEAGEETEVTATVEIMDVGPEIENGGFETGDLSGWTVASGNTFSDASVVDTGHYWDEEPFNHEGTFHLRGLVNGETSVGRLVSEPFIINGSGVVSLLLGAGARSDEAYVSITRVRDDEEIGRISNTAFDYIDDDHPFEYAENYHRFHLDLSEHMGEIARVEIVDEDSHESFFSFLNVDDVTTYHEEDPRVQETLTNPDFESSLDGWTPEEGLDVNRETEGDLPYMVTTPSAEGSVASAPFRLTEDVRFITFMMRGDEHTRITLQDHATGETLASLRGDASREALHRFVFDVEAYQGEVLSIAMTDETPDGNIALGDITFEEGNLESLDGFPYSVVNGGFESGNLLGWTSLGGAFNEDSVSEQNTFWEDIEGETRPYHHIGEYHLDGNRVAESETGALQSNVFKVRDGSFLSMLLGAGKDSEEAFVQLKDASTDQVLHTFTNEAFDFEDFDTSFDHSNDYVRRALDLSSYEGRVVYLSIVDIDHGDADFSFINVDDIRIMDSLPVIPETITLSLSPFDARLQNHMVFAEGTEVTVDDEHVDYGTPGMFEVDVTHAKPGSSNETVTVEVIIEDNQPPSIEGAEDLLFIEGETDKASYDFLEGVTASDALGRDVTLSLDDEEYDAIDLSTKGTYPLTVSAEGENGLVSEEIMDIEVINPSHSLENGGFETGDLSGWKVIEGQAFSESGVTDQATYWDEAYPFYHKGDYHFHGLSASAEDATGSMRSDYFKVDGTVSGYVSFMMGAANEDHAIRVEIVDAFSKEVVEVFKNTHRNSNDYIRYYADLSGHGDGVYYFRIVDESAHGSDFAYINVDDFITDYDKTPDTGIVIDNESTVLENEPFDPASMVGTPSNIPSNAVDVTHEGNVDTTTAGSYTITITADYQGLVVEREATIEIVPNPYTLENGGFETGDLTGWTVEEGAAFCEAGVVTTEDFWGGDFGHEGDHHFRGIDCGSETHTGTMRSSTFELGGSGVISMLIGAGRVEDDVYVTVHDATSDDEIARITNDRFVDPDHSEHYDRHYLDLSGHLGETLYIRVHDQDDNDYGFAFINIDDIITYYEDNPIGGDDE